MTKYYPIPTNIDYYYSPVPGQEKTVIRSTWEVELSANEDIEIRPYVDAASYIFTVELLVKSSGGPAVDHKWTGTVEPVICRDKVYDPAITTDPAARINAVRNKILSLLTFYRSNEYKVIVSVTIPGTPETKTNTNIISGSGDVVIPT
jgi:hypothetical protein